MIIRPLCVTSLVRISTEAKTDCLRRLIDSAVAPTVVLKPHTDTPSSGLVPNLCLLVLARIGVEDRVLTHESTTGRAACPLGTRLALAAPVLWHSPKIGASPLCDYLANNPDPPSWDSYRNCEFVTCTAWCIAGCVKPPVCAEATSQWIKSCPPESL